MSDATEHEVNQLITTIERDYGVSRRLFLQSAAAGMLLLGVHTVGHAAPQKGILAVRIWPADDYTRVTIESSTPLNFKQFMLDNPDRLVIDLQGIEANNILKNLGTKVLADDPYIKAARVGLFQPGVVRVVLDLKTQTIPELFMLNPVKDYGYRLVVDLRPQDGIAQLGGTQQAPSQTASTPDTAQSQPNTTRKPVIVMLDPGHGGEDPGAIGPAGTYEKNITLIMGKKLQAALNSLPNMQAHLTRDKDFFVPLGERVNKARKVKADLFVSIHADAFIKPEVQGASVFALSKRGATSGFARHLAATENKADLIGGVKLKKADPTLARTLLDLTQTATMNDSLKVAQRVLKELQSVAKLHSKQVEQANFAVLRAPDIPSILVETAFISNPQEEKNLLDENHQNKLAQAIVKGLHSFVQTSPSLLSRK